MDMRYWRIRGYRGVSKFFDELVPLGCLTAQQVQDLIKCLTAKEGLTCEEIIGAYVKRRTKLAHGLLEVRKNGPYPEYCCGHDLWFNAMVVDKDGKRPDYPRF